MLAGPNRPHCVGSGEQIRGSRLSLSLSSMIGLTWINSVQPVLSENMAHVMKSRKECISTEG
jgi:hypothetical protein